MAQYVDVTTVDDIQDWLESNYYSSSITCSVYVSSASIGYVGLRRYLFDDLLCFDLVKRSREDVLDFIQTVWTEFTRVVFYYKGKDNHLKLVDQQQAFTFETTTVDIFSRLPVVLVGATAVLTSNQGTSEDYDLRELPSGEYQYEWVDNTSSAPTFCVTHFADLSYGEFTVNTTKFFTRLPGVETVRIVKV